jgi:alcohol dehydrogenase
MLPSVLAFNAPAAGPLYLELASELPGKPPETVDAFIDWFEVLIVDSGLPTSLEAAEVPASALPMLAADAMHQQRLLVNNPVPVDESAALALYERAWRGAR